MRAEERVVDYLQKMVGLTFSACENLRKGILENNYKYLEEVSRIEKDGDELRRLISSEIYDGAFLPYMRPNIFLIAEKIDEILNTAYHVTLTYQKIKDRKLIEEVIDEVEIILEANARLCSILSKNFADFLKNPNRLKEGSIVIRMIEREVDNIKHGILERLRNTKVDFWDGLFIFNFIESLEKISDLVEEVSDILQMTVLSL